MTLLGPICLSIFERNARKDENKEVKKTDTLE